MSYPPQPAEVSSQSVTGPGAAPNAGMVYATPAGYAGATYEDNRPKVVRTMAIIGIVFASLAILNHVAGLVIMAFSSAPSIGGIAGYWPIVDSIVSAALALMLIFCAIDALRTRPSGRRAMMLWAGLHLSYLLIHAIVTVTIVLPATVPAIQQQLRMQGNAPGASIAGTAAYAGAIIMLAIIAIYPALVLILLGRPSVRERYDFAAQNPIG